MSTIVILVDGVDVTSHVIFADAQFTQQANGQAGSAHCRLRDPDHVLAPKAGQTLTVDVDSVRVWGGWVLKVSPGFFFAVDDTRDPTETERVWVLEGVDYNILFSKRFLINRAHPTQQLPTYPAGTPDDQIVLDMVQRFLEVGGDGISTAGVTHVGTPSPDAAFNAANPGDAWGTGMNMVAGPMAAVFYIDPVKTLWFVDVETVTAPYGLSDEPDHVTSFGYRDMEIMLDGTKLINDMMVWGAGPHSTPDIRFKRVEDADSISLHGRWQQGEFTSALFTTSGVTQRASSFVYGSPQSKRGGKDDSIQISCTVYQPGFTAGQVVDFQTNVFGYDAPLPIRRMGIRFPTPTAAEFQLFLSWDVDAPWSNYEWWFPKNNFPGPIGGGIYFPKPPKFPPVVLPPKSGCQCGQTDTFNRVLAGTWGQADCAIDWNLTSIYPGVSNEENAPYFAVDGTAGIIQISGAMAEDPFICLPIGTFVPTIGSPKLFSWDWVVDVDGRELEGLLDGNTGPFYGLDLFVSAPAVYVTAYGSDSDLYTTTTSEIPIGALLHCKMQVHGGEVSGKIWADGDSEPDWQAVGGDPTIELSPAPAEFYFLVPNVPDGEVRFSNLAIDGIDKCVNTISDTFDRTLDGSWGSPSPSKSVTLYGDTVPTNTWMSPDEFSGTYTPSGALHVAGGMGHIDYDAVGSTGDDWAQGIMADANFTYPFEVLWTGISVTAPTMPDWYWQSYIMSLWGINYVGFDNWIAIYEAPFDSHVGPPSLNITDFNGIIDDPAPVIITDWSDGTPMNLRVRIDDTGVHAKIWATADAEPGAFTVSAAYHAGESVDSWQRLRGVSIESDVTSNTPPFPFLGQLYVDSMQVIEGQTLPCFSDQGLTVHIHDSFDRANSPIEGSTTDTGQVWDATGDGADVVSNQWESGGGDGLFWTESIPGLLGSGVETTFDINFNGGSSITFNTSFALNNGMTATATIGQKFNPSTLNIETYVEAGVSDGTNQVVTTTFWDGYVDYSGSVVIDVSRRSVTISANGFLAQASVIDAIPALLPQITSISDFEWSGGTSTAAVIANDLDIVGTTSNSDPSAGMATGGVICQPFGGGVLQYTVSQSYVPGTTKVYVDGTFQGLGDEYTETDAVAGTILFGSPPAPPSTVTICFTAWVA